MADPSHCLTSADDRTLRSFLDLAEGLAGYIEGLKIVKPDYTYESFEDLCVNIESFVDELMVQDHEHHSTYLSFLDLCNNVDDYIEDEAPKFHPFLRLPLELREMVYSFHLKRFFLKESHWAHNRPNMDLIDLPQITPIRVCTRVALPNICRTSKQMRFEASRGIVRSVVCDIARAAEASSLKNICTAWRGFEGPGDVQSISFPREAISRTALPRFFKGKTGVPKFPMKPFSNVRYIVT